MAAFTTGLEGLVEKVALAVPAGQSRGARRALPKGIPASTSMEDAGLRHQGQQLKGMDYDQKRQYLGFDAPLIPPTQPTTAAAPTRPPARASRSPGLLRRGAGALAQGLAVPALITAGGLGYGLVRENEQDALRHRQVYAPMGPSSVYGS